jgi:hypothetical protein
MADLVKKTNGILDGSQQVIQNVTLATAHMNAVSAKIDDGQGTVGALGGVQVSHSKRDHDNDGSQRRHSLSAVYRKRRGEISATNRSVDLPYLDLYVRRMEVFQFFWKLPPESLSSKWLSECIVSENKCPPAPWQTR